MRILAVEDEVLVAMVLREALEAAGHDVMGPAATMAEALALCEAERPDRFARAVRFRTDTAALSP